MQGSEHETQHYTMLQCKAVSMRQHYTMLQCKAVNMWHNITQCYNAKKWAWDTTVHNITHLYNARQWARDSISHRITQLYNAWQWAWDAILYNITSIIQTWAMLTWRLLAYHSMHQSVVLQVSEHHHPFYHPRTVWRIYHDRLSTVQSPTGNVIGGWRHHSRIARWIRDESTDLHCYFS